MHWNIEIQQYYDDNAFKISKNKKTNRKFCNEIDERTNYSCFKEANLFEILWEHWKIESISKLNKRKNQHKSFIISQK